MERQAPKSKQPKNRELKSRESKKQKPAHKLYLAIVILTVLLNGISWCSTVFCDNYVRYVFPLWVNTYGRLTGIFPFSVGEWLIFVGLVVLAAALESQGLVQIKDQVYQDDIFVKPEDWERIEKEALFDTKTVSKAADTFVDTTLKVNGVTDGKVSYSRVVELMLEYEYENFF